MKYKTIKISETLHERIKKFCDENGMKLNKSCEKWLESNIIYAETLSDEGRCGEKHNI